MVIKLSELQRGALLLPPGRADIWERSFQNSEVFHIPQDKYYYITRAHERLFAILLSIRNVLALRLVATYASDLFKLSIMSSSSNLTLPANVNESVTVSLTWT